jgi:hypothetical protein
MRLRLPPYLVLLLAACAGTEVGNPTFACSSGDTMGAELPDGLGGGGGTGGTPDRTLCAADGSDCGLAAGLGSFQDATCPGGTGRLGLGLANLTDAPIAGHIEVADDGSVEVAPDHFALGPHESVLVAVVFAPPADAAAGEDGATLRIVLDGEPPRELVLQVDTYVDPAARASLGMLCGNDAPCEVLDLGEVAVGQTATSRFTVVNDGCTALSLLAPDFGADSPLSLLSPPEFPVAIPEGGLLQLEVAFTPAAVGPTAGDVVLSTAGGLERTLPWMGHGR